MGCEAFLPTTPMRVGLSNVLPSTISAPREAGPSEPPTSWNSEGEFAAGRCQLSQGMPSFLACRFQAPMEQVGIVPHLFSELNSPLKKKRCSRCCLPIESYPQQAPKSPPVRPRIRQYPDRIDRSKDCEETRSFLSPTKRRKAGMACLTACSSFPDTSFF